MPFSDPPDTIYILGAGGFAKELKCYFETFYLPIVYEIVLVGPGQEYNPTPWSYTIIGSGHYNIRERMLAEIKQKVCPAVNFGSTVLSKNVGEGTVASPGSVIAPNTTIGKHVLINYNATVGHDTTIGDLSVIAPNASIGGSCRIGKGVYIGAGANIKESAFIADGVVVGMGAVVLEDIVVPNLVVVGIPAKPKVGLFK